MVSKTQKNELHKEGLEHLEQLGLVRQDPPITITFQVYYIRPEGNDTDLAGFWLESDVDSDLCPDGLTSIGESIRKQGEIAGKEAGSLIMHLDTIATEEDEAALATEIPEILTRLEELGAKLPGYLNHVKEP